jgi:hypothetical protein
VRQHQKEESMKRPLPEHLHAAYDWTSGAGELTELQCAKGPDLERYARESAANWEAHPSGAPVTEADLMELSAWLRENR